MPAKGYHQSEWGKKRTSETHKGKSLSLEHRRKISERQKGRCLSEETKRKISESQRGRTIPYDVRRKMSMAKKGDPKVLENLRRIRSLPRNPKTRLERKVASWLSMAKIQFVPEYFLEDKRFDFAIPTQKILVECDGAYWHSFPEKVHNDELKNQIAQRNGWRLVRLPEADFEISLAKLNLLNALGKPS